MLRSPRTSSLGEAVLRELVVMTSKRLGMIAALVVMWSLTGLIGFAPTTGLVLPMATMGTAHAGLFDISQVPSFSGQSTSNTANGDPDQYVDTQSQAVETEGDPDQYVGDPEVGEVGGGDPDPSDDPSGGENEPVETVFRFFSHYLGFLF
jgi:hypothetical protein